MSFENPNYNYEGELSKGSVEDTFTDFRPGYGFPGVSSHLTGPFSRPDGTKDIQHDYHDPRRPTQQYGFPFDPRLAESSTGSEKSRDSPDLEQDYHACSTFNPLLTVNLEKNNPTMASVDDNWVLQDKNQRLSVKARQFIESIFDSPEHASKNNVMQENGSSSFDMNGHNKSEQLGEYNYEFDSTNFGSREFSPNSDSQAQSSTGGWNPESYVDTIPDDQCKYLDISMGMAAHDHRFGFSVMGGVDEGFPARIDELTIGSPADRTELEVGDEIMEVNGHNMEGCTHGEIISHIHQCIKSRTIKLRVKRNTSGENFVPSSSDIQDAYVIAVEDQARQRLEELSALKKVRPVDIGKLQDFGNNNLNSEHKILDENSAVYVASPESINSPTHGSQLSGEDPSCAELNVDKSGEKTEALVEPVYQSVEEEAALCDKEVAELEESSKSAPEPNQTNEPDMEMSVMNGYPDAHYGSQHNPNINGNYNQAMAGMRYSNDMYDNMDQSADDSDVSNGHHREMAIDVPENFVARKKEPPRYPTSRGSNQGTPPSSGHGTPRHSVQSHSTPTRQGDKRPVSQDPASLQQPPKMSKEEQIQHFERIKKYQEDLTKRKEQRDKMEAEQEFLRTSLRGSKKLQALEEQQLNSRVLPSGIVNPNYVEEAEEQGAFDTHSKASTLPIPSRDPKGFMVKKPISTGDIFTSLQHIQKRLRSVEDQKDLAALSKFFQNSRFQQALAIHNKVIEVSLRTPQPFPACDNATEISTDVVKTCLAEIPSNTYAEELSKILSSPHVKALMYAQDRVADQKASPTKTTTEDDERDYLYERASQYGEESIKIVRLQKTADPLGATVRNDGDSVVIGRIVKGGAAEKSGLLHEGDEILEINGIDIRGKSVNDVCDLMASLTGTLTFLIIPSLDQRAQPPPEQVVHVRALFNYDPEDDIYIPCRELGISFMVGDILHVINQEDPNWWQAYREGEDDQTLAGLIPSQTFQEQREAMRQTIVSDGKENSKKKQKCRCTRKHPKKKKKKMYSGAGDDTDAEEILTYEEVALYYPQPNRKRPVVLIGPPNVGRQELRQRLMESNVERFAAAIPHTSRPMKTGETDSKDYHFIPRLVFEEDIKTLKFVEYGEFKKDLYGTTLQAIREVVASGKICVLNLQPQSLRIMKNSDLKPYVVFVAPPNIEKLKQLRQKQGISLSDDELKDIIEKSREMEENYGHYFDFITTNHDLDNTYMSLLEQINSLEIEPQWVPGFWLS